jgi:hypothetical protein
MQSAGTEYIARESGGDSMPVTNADSLQDTLERLRQRYTLFYHLPEGASAADARNVQVYLADNARRRYADAEVRYRRTSQTDEPTKKDPDNPVFTRRAPDTGRTRTSAPSDVDRGQPDEPEQERRTTVSRRRNAPRDDSYSGPRANTTVRDDVALPPPPRQSSQAESAPASSRGGWRRVDENDREEGPLKETVTQPVQGEQTPASSGGGWRKLKPGEQP